jgi:hypothetical protein
MLELFPAKQVHGTIRLPSNPDVLPLVAVLASALRVGVALRPVVSTPVVSTWTRAFEDLLHSELQGDTLTLTPREHAQSAAVLRLPDAPLACADFVVFCAIASGVTVSVEHFTEVRRKRWTELARRADVELRVADEADGASISAVGNGPLIAPATPLPADDIHALLGLAAGRGSRVSFTVDSPLSTPLRQCAPVFGCDISVRATGQERVNDPLLKRIRRMKGKSAGQDTPQLFEVSADFSSPPTERIEVELPGDDVLGAAFVVAKSLVQRGNLIIENVPLESWGMPILQLVKRMGCAPAIQETHATSFGQAGMVQLQHFELSGRKTECIPAYLYGRQLPAMLVLALFSEGESVFRWYDTLAAEVPDVVQRMSTFLDLLGAHHGEMTGGVVLRGAHEYDGFDLRELMPPLHAAAFAMAAVRCVGRSSMEEALLRERWPTLPEQLSSLCEFRT